MIVLVRHGRTAANAGGLLQGRLDLPLDDVGQAQAERLVAAVGPVARVVSSPLLRARQTATCFGVPVTVDERWVELDYGEWDGQPLGAVQASSWARWRDDVSFAPPGGESLAALAARVVSALGDLLAEAGPARPAGARPAATTVVVSHVSPIKTAMAWALGAGWETTWRSHLDQASITRIGMGPRGPVLRSFNETAHLHGLLPPG